MQRKFVVLGAGPAGVAAALEAAHLGAHVTLVDPLPVGGRATWSSLLPSKAWLHRAGSGLLADRSAPFGTHLSHITTLAEQRSQQLLAALDAAQVLRLQGKGRLTSPRSVEVTFDDGNVRTLEGDAVFLATGSGPSFSQAIKPDGKHVIAPRMLRNLTALPRSVVVIGGGVTGIEVAHLFSAFHIPVTLLSRGERVLPGFDRDVVGELCHHLSEHGVVIHTGVDVQQVQGEDDRAVVRTGDDTTYQADIAFLATGRKPDLSGLGLEDLDVHVLHDVLPVDGFGRTAASGLYAGGDITGPPMTANRARALGRAAARHALGASVRPVYASELVEGVYTTPELAQVGVTEEDARRARPIRVLSGPLDGLKARIEGHSPGLAKLVIDARTNVVIGAAAVGAHAVDALAPIALAVKAKLPLTTVAELFPGHPAFSEAFFDLARGRAA